MKSNGDLFMNYIEEIKEKHLNEKDAITKITENGFKPSEAYDICLQEFKYMDRAELLRATYGPIGEKAPIRGYYGKYDITVFDEEDAK